MTYQFKTRLNDNSSLLSRILIIEKRLQNETDEAQIAEMEQVRAGMVAAYRGRFNEVRRHG